MDPMFDNVEFREDISGSEDLFPGNRDRQDNYYLVETSASESGDNVVYGNRNYLMLLNQYHEVIKN